MKINGMDQFLHWYAQNNKLIIQVLAVLIGIFLISLVYRIFFGVGDAAEESETAIKPEHFNEIDKKISGVMSALENLQQQTSKPAPESSLAGAFADDTPPPKPEPILGAEDTPVATAQAADGGMTASVDPMLLEENEKLKNELDALKANLKTKEKEVADVKAQLEEQRKIAEKGAKTPTRVMIDTATLNGDKDLIAKIDELQKKLAEYDIIAEDISELQTLRKENAELKGAATAAAPAEEKPPEGT